MNKKISNNSIVSHLLETFVDRISTSGTHAVFVVNAEDYSIVKASIHCEKITGRDLHDILDMSFMDLFPESITKNIKSLFRRSKRAASNEKFITTLPNPKHYTMILEFNALHFEAADESYFFIQCKDNTERIFNFRKSLQQAKFKSLGVLGSGIAHQMNNPVAIINGMLECLYEDYFDENNVDGLMQYLEDNRQVFESLFERTFSIVNRLKQLHDDTRSISKSNHNMVEICNNVFLHFQEYLEKAGIEPTVSFSQSNPNVPCIRNDIEYVLQHLIQNSADAFTKFKVEHKYIKVNITSTPQKAVISYEDNAGGIPEEMINRVFDPFFTTKPISKDVGMGLGLALSYAIIKNHHGDISIRAIPGEGTHFEITLPT